MATTWENLTPEGKYQERLQQWLSPAEVLFASEEAAKNYRERVTRISCTMRLEEPDRVPVTIQSGNFPVYYTGSTLRESMYNYEILRDAWRHFSRDFYDDMDYLQGPGLIYSGRVLDLIQYKLLRWPGRGIDAGMNTYQYVEDEYMLADEYDALIKNPYEFAVKTFLPRVLGMLAPFKNSTPFSQLLVSPMSFITPMASPDFQNALSALTEAGRELAVWQRVIDESHRETMALGLPFMNGGYTMAPFDAIADYLRGTRGIMTDMYRQPDKLLEAIDRITPLLIEDSISLVNSNKGFIVGLALHKGDDSFMSQAQFEKFYWPSLKKVILAMIEEGALVWLFAEGRYSKRLETIADLPKGWVTWMFDQTDMTRAKKVLGGTACIAGNVPASLNCFGSAAEVIEYCHKLIDTCAPGGGYILTGGGNLTEAKPENFRAMMVAAKEYGMY